MSPQDKEILKKRLYIIIFGTDTPAGKLFDLVLLALIGASVLVVLLESVKDLRDLYGFWFHVIEYLFTFVFTVEYILRIWISRKPWGYVKSFYGIIDLLSILPTYLAIIITSSQYLMVIRILRLMRVFRILKLARFMKESQTLWNSLKASRAKIAVFIFSVFMVAVIMGTLMYLIEGEEGGFTSIPRGIYWAIVTVTTVGFGDIHPATAVGQFFASILMVLGYGIIAIPTGLVSAEMAKNQNLSKDGTNDLLEKQHCNNCGKTSIEKDAEYCMKCGAKLPDRKE
ncbi:MAG: ion transporter [Salibacteraceae bacterium]